MSSYTILIVEDDAWQAEQQVIVLEKVGYKTSVSHSAEAAIDSVDDTIPDAIVLDMLLGGSTAFALMHELQSYGDTGSIPIILCTNLATDVQLDDVQPYGVRRILDKTTMVPNDIVTAVRSVLL